MGQYSQHLRSILSLQETMVSMIAEADLQFPNMHCCSHLHTRIRDYICTQSLTTKLGAQIAIVLPSNYSLFGLTTTQALTRLMELQVEKKRYFNHMKCSPLYSLRGYSHAGGNLIYRSGNPISKVRPSHLHPSRCDSELEVELHCYCGITPTSNFYFN